MLKKIVLGPLFPHHQTILKKILIFPVKKLFLPVENLSNTVPLISPDPGGDLFKTPTHMIIGGGGDMKGHFIEKFTFFVIKNKLL